MRPGGKGERASAQPLSETWMEVTLQKRAWAWPPRWTKAPEGRDEGLEWPGLGDRSCSHDLWGLELCCARHRKSSGVRNYLADSSLVSY